MTDLTTKAAEIRAGLEGVTPGPWTYIAPVPFEGDDENEAGGFVYPGGVEGDDGNPVCVFGDPAGSGTLFENVVDHHHIARLDPATVLAFLDERAEHLATIARLEGEREDYRSRLEGAFRRFTAAEAERDELLREKERLGAEVDHQRSGKEKAQDLLDVSIEQTSRANERSVALAELVGAAISIFENCSVQSGVCCCGDAMDNHPEPMDCGHSPVDHGEYASIEWLASARSALENGPAGLADAHTKSPESTIATQSERIAALEAALHDERNISNGLARQFDDLKRAFDELEAER